MFIILLKINIPQDKKAEQSINFMKSGDRYYILSDGNVITAYETKEKAQDAFGYNEYHRRDAQWSASACVHWLQFAPVIYEVKDLDDLMAKFFKDQERFQTCNLSSMAGRLQGIEITPVLGKQRYDEGERVELISN